MDLLKPKVTPSPDFIGYEVNDIRIPLCGRLFVSRCGTLQGSTHTLRDIDVRVGDYQYEHTHQIRGHAGWCGGNFPLSGGDPLYDDLDAPSKRRLQIRPSL